MSRFCSISYEREKTEQIGRNIGEEDFDCAPGRRGTWDYRARVLAENLSQTNSLSSLGQEGGDRRGRARRVHKKPARCNDRRGSGKGGIVVNKIVFAFCQK